MKTISIRIHPLALAFIVSLCIPAVAIAAGTILTPPVTVTGTSSGSLFTSTNGGSGAAMTARSNNGRAVKAYGLSTGVYAATTNPSGTTHAHASGVAGYDASADTGTLNYGVYGQSKFGTGVAGRSADSNGVVGTTSLNGTPPAGANAVLGVDTNNVTQNGQDFNTGVSGYGYGVAVFGQSNASFCGETCFAGAGVHGDGSLGVGDGVLGSASYGNALEGINTSGNGTGLNLTVGGLGMFMTTGSSDAFQMITYGTNTGILNFGLGDGRGIEVLGAAPASSNLPAIDSTCSTGAPLMIGHGTTGDIMSIDCSGNLIVSGSVTAHGTPLATQHNSGGRGIGTYATQQTIPSIDDIGEGQLLQGKAFVPLSADFASVIDGRAQYLVFITPQGQCNGLYVTQKGPSGFWVREIGAGMSAVAFDYRVVAKPLGGTGKRLPSMSDGPRPDPDALARAAKLRSDRAIARARFDVARTWVAQAKARRKDALKSALKLQTP